MTERSAGHFHDFQSFLRKVISIALVEPVNQAPAA
jgi:hypothetical protein